MHPRPLLDLATMRDIAARCRCSVVRVQRWNSRLAGRPGLAYELECPSHAAKVRLLDALAWNDAKRDMQLREVAVELASEAGRSALARARAIHRFVALGVDFAREPREVFQDAFWTLALGVGDCDDHYRVVAALGRAIGLAVRPKTLMSRVKPGVPTHVAAQFGFPVKKPRRWVWAETTLRAHLGEHPRAAKRRLQARGRADIG